MTYKLYNRDGMGGFVVEAALVKAGQPVEITTIDTKTGAHHSAEFEAVNPMRQVPALVLPDGTLMTETAAIVIHLLDRFPDAGLGPRPGTGDHAAFLRWVVFMSVNVYEPDLRYYYGERYTHDPAGADGVKQAAYDKMKHALGILNGVMAQNGGFVVGNALSLADVYLTMLAGWFPGDHGLAHIKNVARLVQEDTHYGPVWSRHFGSRRD